MEPEGYSTADIDNLVRAHTGLAAIFGIEHVDVVALKCRLDQARAAKRDALPIAAKVRNAETALK